MISHVEYLLCLFRSSAHFLIGSVGFLTLSCMSYLYILSINPYHIVSFLALIGCLFILSMIFFDAPKLLSLISFHLLLFLCLLLQATEPLKQFCNLYQRVFCFSASSFMVSSYTFRYLIHFEFIFIYDVRKCSNFIVLHVAVQFSQYCLLLKKFIFSIVYSCFLVVGESTPNVEVYFWAFNSFPLIYMSVFVPLPYCFDYYSFIGQFEIKAHDIFNPVLFHQVCFDSSGFFVVPYKFQDNLF